MFFVLFCLVTSISREFKQITTAGAATAAVTQKVWEENAKKHGLWGLNVFYLFLTAKWLRAKDDGRCSPC